MGKQQNMENVIEGHVELTKLVDGMMLATACIVLPILLLTKQHFYTPKLFKVKCKWHSNDLQKLKNNYTW